MLLVLFELFWRFAQVGLFAIGGGLATLPFLYDMSEATHWFSTQDISNMIAVSQSTPGPIGVNMATYAGFLTQGILGGILATIGLVFPSLIIIIAVLRVIERFKESSLVKDIFYGLRPASAALILAAGLSVAQETLLNIPDFQQEQNLLQLFDFKAIILAGFIFFLTRKTKLHPISLIVLSAVLGIIFQF